jgi:excisionase family DNA binding protein
MNAKAYYSISEAARQLGVSQKTIQRAVTAEKLKWYGVHRSGRLATGIDLDEARDHFNKSNTAKFKPVWLAVKEFLDDPDRLPAPTVIPQNEKILGEPVPWVHSPEDVLLMYMAAISGGIDVDCLLYCVDRLRAEDGIFVHMIMEDMVDPLLTDHLHNYAAEKLREYAELGDYKKIVRNVTFQTLWEKLMQYSLQAQVDVSIALVCDQTDNTATLELVPNWLFKAPQGLLPIIGGRQSVIKMRRTTRNKIDSIATQIWHVMQSSPPEHIDAQFNAFMAYQFESIVKSSSWRQYIKKMEQGVTFLLSDESDLSLLDEDLTEGENLLTGIRHLAESYKLSMDDARKFLLAWARMTSDVGKLRNNVYLDAIWQSSMSDPVNITVDDAVDKDTDADEDEDEDINAEADEAVSSIDTVPNEDSKVSLETIAPPLPSSLCIQFGALGDVFGVTRKTIWNTVDSHRTKGKALPVICGQKLAHIASSDGDEGHWRATSAETGSLK